MIRKTLFWLHLVVGIITGLVIFTLCLTGAILAFEQQIVDRLEHDPRARAPRADAELLPPKDLIASAAKVEAAHVITLEWSADPNMPVRFMGDHRHYVLLNGYTGEVLSHGATGVRDFMRWTTDLHVRLVASLGGEWMVSISNACFVFLILSGLWLWWPRQWRWKALRHSIAIRFDVKGKARDWNWHNALGFWFLLPLLFISVSGLALSFHPVDQWWRKFGGEHVLSAAARPTKLAATTAAAEPATRWSQWMQRVQQHYPGWRSIVVFGSATPNKDGVVTFAVNFGTLRQMRNITRVKLDTRTGQLLEEQGWSSDEGSARARSIIRLGHTGEIIGTGGQILAFLGCLAGLVLVYTGFALNWRRFFGRV